MGGGGSRYNETFQEILELKQNVRFCLLCHTSTDIVARVGISSNSTEAERFAETPRKKNQKSCNAFHSRVMDTQIF